MIPGFFDPKLFLSAFIQSQTDLMKMHFNRNKTNLTINSKLEETMDCVWDRGSLVALPEELRDRYTKYLKIIQFNNELIM